MFERARRRIGAGLLGLCVAGAVPLARAETVRVEHAGPEQKRAAQKTFEAGDDLYESGRYGEALTAFRASHALVASPNSRLMIARCLRELGRVDAAFSELEATVSDAEASGGRYAETAAAARAELEDLRDRLAYVIVKAPSDPEITRFSIGDRVFERDAFERPVAVTPGSVEVSLQRANGERLPIRVDVAAGETRPAELAAEAPKTESPARPAVVAAAPANAAPAPAPEHGSWRRTAAYVAAGVGVVGLGGFAALGLMNNARYSELESECPDGRCAGDRRDEIDTGRRLQTFANVALAVGAAGAVTSITLFVLAPSTSSKNELRASVVGRSLHVTGSF